MTDGILKYALDYCSNADYETGYIKYHQRNAELYKKIDSAFKNKNACGVRVYEYENKFLNMDCEFSEKCEKPQYMFFSAAARTLAYNTIPTVYEGSGVCGAVFDENARHIPLDTLAGGMIIDITAAKILMERGVDVGIERIGSFVCDGVEEHFLHDNNHILSLGTKVCDITLNKNAEILSDMQTSLGNLPVSFIYENANGERFLVLNINTRILSKNDNSNLLYHYARSEQYATQIQRLSKKALPAYVYGNPSLYILCKEDENSLTVGLWNFFADTAFTPTVKLWESYKEIEFIAGNGQLLDDKVELCDIAPFSFAGFTVKK